MSNIATYTFVPWLREGIANQIGGQSGIRASIPVELSLSGDGVSGGTINRPAIQKDIEIYGPGDITGLDPKTIIKVEPLNWITNFEPNYLPYIDFYDEDLPWRYSPLTPSGHRLVPWIMLVVLKESEFADGKNIKDRPLPYVLPKAGVTLPPPSQLWAWAHVQINKDLLGTKFNSTNAASIQSQLVSTLNGNPDMGYSRVLCPRKLEANTSYHAFLVPTFESGRLAGVGQDPSGAASHDTMAWTDTVVPTELPYYHRWFFRTGTVGDFEYLVRLLKPQPIDKRVGIRDMDVQKPGANIRGIIDAPDATDTQKLGGILKLGGALKIPDIFYDTEEFKDILKYRNWATLNNTQPYPHPFQSDLASFINLTDTYEDESALVANSNANITEEQVATDKENEYGFDQNPDPIITAPLYARWHSLTKRLLKSKTGADLSPNDNWVHELNLDPRWRTASGFGTKVVQENQEDYMQSSWEQVGEVLESNKKIKYAQLSKEVTHVWHAAHLGKIKDTEPDKWLSISAPIHQRILKGVTYQENNADVVKTATAFFEIKQSKLPQAAVSTSLRKFMRPRGILMKRFSFDNEIRVNNIASRINNGDASAAPPRISPHVFDELQDQIENAVKPTNLPGFLKNWLTKHKWFKWVPLIIAIILIIILFFILGTGTAFYTTAVTIIGAMIYLFRLFLEWSREMKAAEVVLPENKTPEAVDDWPKSPNFTLSTLGNISTDFRLGTTDSEEAKSFKIAMKDAYSILQTSIAMSVPVVKPSLDISAVNTVIFESLDPEVTIKRWIFGSVFIPERIKEQLKETFVEAMAYPEIDLPMYKPLVNYSSELFLPNINFIAQNSISLLETNQKFIEAYMVGLNHEFARELLWREYPTDQRGSYFRQFWEAIGFLNIENLDEDTLKEKLKDIPPIHLWSKFSKLGDHDHREEPGDNEEEVVLVIRGELLKKYPNAVIYAHKAAWRDSDDKIITKPEDKDKIDPKKERDLLPLTPAQEAEPPKNIIKTPLYEAKVDPDIHFFGFDLTTCEAKGGTGKESIPVDQRCADKGITWDHPGWFFVIKERPGEPRFGLDISEGSNVETQNDGSGKIEVWNDLSWNDLTPAVSNGEFIQITNQTQTITADQALESDDLEKTEQQGEDSEIIWSSEMSSSELAYVLYQVPVLVAVHATEMLPDT